MPLGKANQKWCFQRITALLLVPLVIWFIPALIKLPELNYQAAIKWLTTPLNSLLFGAFLLILIHHAWLGVSEVIEDYIHIATLKQFCLLILFAGSLFLAGFSLHTLYSLSL